MKRKPHTSPERSLPARGKTPKLGVSSPSPSAKEQGSPVNAGLRGQAPSPLAEVLTTPGPRLRSSSAIMAKGLSRRVVEPPFEVMPISVRSPPA